ncbi:hypothetical protein ABIE85_008360 [Bradyrhizobium diazoefficiens]|jgi:hypothetical protein|nr:hypothetical protein [Bradyrhizobium diazoefficiens]WLA58529.1 hypothetical protein QIH81_07670 [Bradyrhizobium diazoefficiens]
MQFFTALAFLIGAAFTALLASYFAAGIGQGWIGLIGTVLGAAISVGAVTFHDNRRRKQEIAALKASLYAEIADRAARCANDYIKPWKGWKDRQLGSDVKKFCPTPPAVLPAVAGKLGLLDARTLLAVTQFYFRLSALREAFEFVAVETKPDGSDHEQHVAMIQDRLRSCFRPALRSLESLSVPSPSEFDKEAAEIYPHLKAERDTLRNTLLKYAGER